MHLYTCTDFTGTLIDCNEGTLEWVPKAEVENLPIWQGDKIFLRLLAEGAPFFHLELTYHAIPWCKRCWKRDTALRLNSHYNKEIK